MGGGKTSFIIPVLALYTMIQKNDMNRKAGHKTDRDYDKFIYVLPTTLVKQSTNIIGRYLSHLIPTQINTINITRTQQRDKEAKHINDICIMSDTSIKSFILNSKEHNHTQKSILENEDVFVVTDEIDDIIDPMKSELNYPDNPNKAYKDNYSNFIIKSLVQLVKYFALNEKLLKKYENMRDKRAPNHLVIQIPPDTLYSDFLTELKPETDWEFHDFIKDKKKLEKFRNLILNKEITYTLNNDKKIMKIKILYDIFSSVIPTILGQVYNLNFGLLYPDELPPNLNEATHFFALPYKAAKKPIVGSQFTSIEITLAFTIICYFINGLRKIDIQKLLIYLQKQIENLSLRQLSKNEYVNFYNDHIKPHIKNNIDLHEFPIVDDIKNDKSYRVLRTNKILIEFYLTNVVLSEFFE